jgi:hypothetical protein
MDAIVVQRRYEQKQSTVLFAAQDPFLKSDKT